jgi:hypothetical protein
LPLAELHATLLTAHTNQITGGTPMATQTKTAGNGLIDAYERTLQTVADYQDKVADQTKVDWIADITRAQANFTREISRVYASTARDVLK